MIVSAGIGIFVSVEYVEDFAIEAQPKMARR